MARQVWQLKNFKTNTNLVTTGDTVLISYDRGNQTEALNWDGLADVPPYPNDGYQYVLVQEDGVNVWEPYLSVEGDVVQNVTATTATTNVDLSLGNIVFVDVQANTEITLSSIEAGKKYTFVFTTLAPTKTVTFSSTYFNGFTGTSVQDVVISGLRISGFYWVVDFIGTGGSAFVSERSRNLIGGGGTVDSVVAGTGISVDATDPANPIVSSTITPGGQVDSITGTTDEIDVDSTDPTNPILSLASAVLTSLGLADTAIQPAALAAALLPYLQNIVEDTTPQLGGNLDGTNKTITNVSSISAGAALFGVSPANLRAFNVRGTGLNGRLSLQGGTGDQPGLEMTIDNNASRVLLRLNRAGTDGTKLEIFVERNGGNISEAMVIDEDSTVYIKPPGASVGSANNAGIRNSSGVMQFKNSSGAWTPIPSTSGGQVDSVVGTVDQINVNNTDPENPVLSLATAITDAIALANTSVQSVVAGTNISVDNTDPQNPIVNSTASGGQVDSVVGTTNEIDIDATDPANPIASLATAVTSSLALADSSVQSLTGSDNIDIDATIPTAPVVLYRHIGFQARSNGVSPGQNFVTNAWTKAGSDVFKAVDYDTDSWYDSANARYTPQIEGWYLFNGLITLFQMTDNSKMVVALRKNNILIGLFSRGTVATPAPAVDDAGFGGAFKAFANGTTDYFEMFVFHSATTDKLNNVIVGYNYFGATYLGQF